MVKYYLYTILAVLIFGVPALSSRFGTQIDQFAQMFAQAGDELATVILSHSPKSIADLQAKYNSPVTNTSVLNLPSTVNKVRILLVPGHEPGFGGAEFGTLKEREMTVELAQDLQAYLNTNDHYQVFVTRDDNQWLQPFTDYFKNNWQDIIDWEKASALDMAHRILIGSATKPVSLVIHNSAPNDVAYRLYGITKWANENDIDITIHIHFNDDSVHSGNIPGTFSGFAIYVPEHQYGNSTTSRALAETIFKRLSKYNPVSDLSAESTGLVEDPSLIAVGAHDTANAASMLIEYAYIYEAQFASPDTKSLAIKDLAYQTYLGLEDFFDSNAAKALGNSYDTVVLPHAWMQVIAGKNIQNSDVFALQTALSLDGEYPPANKKLNECPRTGKLGPCTQAALQAFQTKYGITGETNSVGVKTLHVLNQNYGVANTL